MGSYYGSLYSSDAISLVLQNLVLGFSRSNLVAQVGLKHSFSCHLMKLISSPWNSMSNISKQCIIFPATDILLGAGCIWNDIIDRDIDRKVGQSFIHNENSHIC